VAINQSNLGLTRSLNRALALARGEHVARQDADDLSDPGRLEKQVSFLDAHPEIALVGAGACVVDKAGHLLRKYRYPPDDAGLRVALLSRFNPLPHSSVMFRRDVAVSLDGWDERFVKSQDYEFYLRLIEGHRIASLPEPLITLRYTPGSLFSNGVEASEQLQYALLAHALATVRRRRPAIATTRDQPLPLEKFRAWYRASSYPAHFAAGQYRREAQIEVSRGAILSAVRALIRALALDAWHPIRRFLRTPDRAMVELARELEGWLSVDATPASPD
ncbi:MAG: glycosyltransferase, partial [Deltaproteobacteria bacterium]|nr:glycosyltransferase [Deltaproteobacteria bacterium]